MTSVFRVMRFDNASGSEYTVGIQEQFLGKTMYIEKKVDGDSKSDDEILRDAWGLVTSDFETWRHSVITDTSDDSNRYFNIDEMSNEYVVNITDNFMGYTTFLQTTVPKPVSLYTDIIQQAFAQAEPKLQAWRTKVSSGNIVPGRYFHLENNLPILETLPNI